MSSTLSSAINSRYILLARSFIVVFGCIAVWWGVAEFPIFWRGSSIQRIAARIIAGDRFKTEALSKELPVVQAVENSAKCLPSAVRSAAAIRLRIAENSVSSGGKIESADKLAALRNSLQRALSCEPADPFLWLAYVWTESSQNNKISQQMKHLKMSYELGPNEAWIGLMRNKIAFTKFDQLPPDLTKNVIDEFVGLLETGRLYKQVAEIFTGPAWPARDLIIARLDSVPETYRDLLIVALGQLNYEGDLPRSDRPARPPWLRTH